MEFNSLKDFKDNFAQIYKSDVAPQLKYIENERLVVKKKAKLFFNIALAVTVIILIAVFIHTKDLGAVIITGAVLVPICFAIRLAFGKGFEYKLKTQIMPLLMKAFGNFEWTLTDRISKEEIRNSKIFESFEKRSSDDNFFGTYRGMPIEISESKLTYTTTDSDGHSQTHTRFSGVLVSIETGKKFTGHTIVRTRNRDALFYNKKVYQEVKLEDPVFQKEYFVDSNDQIEARYLLTPAFMERFKNISTAFGSYENQCSFQHGKILIALSTNEDLFKLGDLNTPVTDTAPYLKLLQEIISILQMIDHLKITEKTGL